MREIVHIQAGQCGNQIGAKVRNDNYDRLYFVNSFCPQRVGNPKTHYSQYKYQMYLNGARCCSCMGEKCILGDFFLRIIETNCYLCDLKMHYKSEKSPMTT